MSDAAATVKATVGPLAAVDRSRLPELLAPAGDWECAKAAIENGADAIYFGLEKFNARMRAHNFTEADLPKLMEFLHRRGVKGYVTFNTLVFQNELAEAARCLRAIITAGADAAIVQDVGICRLLRRLSPDFPIHASTQMTVTSAAGVEFARELGCNLVVLARECSIREIGKIQTQEQVADLQPSISIGSAGGPMAGLKRSTEKRPLPLEVFIHGALCVAYSGQCLTSEALGGRSANRGECAQACRMPYELISDGRLVPLGDRRYLLSPQDLAGLDVLPELVRSGVLSLKIEGRLKTPEYVANITRVYRAALDSLAVDPESKIENRTYEMEMAFSRGLHTGWFRGINNQELVHARFGKKRGVYLGEVSRIQGEDVVVTLQAPLKPGDGVVFDSGHPEEREEGGRVYEIRSPKSEARNGAAAILSFGRGAIDFSRLRIGDKLWKTSDPELDRRLRHTFEGDQPRFQRPIDFEVHGHAGAPLTVMARDELGHIARAESAMPLAKAERQPLNEERLRAQLGRLGGTPFRTGELRNNLNGDVLLPVSELNRLRRSLVSQLETLRAQPPRWQLNLEAQIPEGAFRCGEGVARQPAATPVAPELIVLVRNLHQLETALQCGVTTLYCEFEDLKKYRDAVRLVRESTGGGAPARTVWVAPPRISKSGEDWILTQVRACDADGYLIRNYDHLRCFAGCRGVGDFSLNIANALAADFFKDRFGLERIAVSYDLNFGQLETLLLSAPPEWFEITIHQHMPMFHMEHCVFCAFLSKGTDYTNCGRPCDKHDVKLRDRTGMEHALKADAGCRNTVFNAVAQTGAEYVARLMAIGARHFRIEFVNESPDLVKQTIVKYRLLLRGELTGGQLWRELRLLNQLGVTRGQMERNER